VILQYCLPKGYLSIVIGVLNRCNGRVNCYLANNSEFAMGLVALAVRDEVDLRGEDQKEVTVKRRRVRWVSRDGYFLGT
jgi:hypothetical protein